MGNKNCPPFSFFDLGKKNRQMMLRVLDKSNLRLQRDEVSWPQVKVFYPEIHCVSVKRKRPRPNPIVS